jgi:transketolase
MSVLAKDGRTEENVFGHAITEAGIMDAKVVVIDADLARATQTDLFSRTFPERYFDVGIAEQNLLCTAAGLAVSGKVPFAGSFASFITKRACDQISVSIAYPRLNVRIVGMEPGISSGRNGATHQAVDDIAIMRAIPNMTVVDPGDATEIRQAVIAAICYQGPVYLRMQRGKIPVIFDELKYHFEFGRAVKLFSGKDAVIISTGIMTEIAIKAVKTLKEVGIITGLVHMPTIKPLDTAAVLGSAKESGAIVTTENHSIIGGLGGAVAETVVAGFPVPMEQLGIKDLFGETGSQAYLMKKFGLTGQDIVEAVKKVVKRKCN